MDLQSFNDASQFKECVFFIFQPPISFTLKKKFFGNSPVGCSPPMDATGNPSSPAASKLSWFEGVRNLRRSFGMSNGNSFRSTEVALLEVSCVEPCVSCICCSRRRRSFGMSNGRSQRSPFGASLLVSLRDSIDMPLSEHWCDSESATHEAKLIPPLLRGNRFFSL